MQENRLSHTHPIRLIRSSPPLPPNPYQNLYEGQGESALGPVSTHHPPLGQYNYPNMWLFKHSFDQINRWDCRDNGFGTSALLVFTVYLWVFKHFKIFLIVLCFVLYTLRITDIDHHSRVCRSDLLNKSYFYCNKLSYATRYWIHHASKTKSQYCG